MSNTSKYQDTEPLRCKHGHEIEDLDGQPKVFCNECYKGAHIDAINNAYSDVLWGDRSVMIRVFREWERE